MNLSHAPTASNAAPLSRPAARGRDAVRSSPWTWMVLACVVLGASGGVRSWQDRRFDAEAESGAVAPFPLKELPTTLKGWRVREGFERRLDPRIVQIAGCSDYVARTYVDELTGVVLAVFIAFGRADLVSAHRPEICFPSCGYKLAEAPSDHEVATGRGPARFRAAVYAKARGGGPLELEEVYCAFRRGGRWSPDASDNRPLTRRSRGVFKVQVQHRVAGDERRDLDNPCERFLAVLLPEIEHRLSAGQGN